jgi:hypothetical protein
MLQSTHSEQTNTMQNTCHKCRGTGRFVGYSGRDCGECFTCGGTGKIAPKAPVGVTLSFPKTIDIVLRNDIRLHLGDCKIVITQAGRLCLVSPLFGSGYYGSFERDGTFRPTKQCTPEMIAKLQDVEARGIEAVKEIGRLTGICCVCGRTLTNEGSIEDGIGPVCAGRMQ